MTVDHYVKMLHEMIEARQGECALQYFLFLTMDSRMEEHSGRKAYAQFDRWGRMCGSNFQIGGAFFRKKKPLKYCPDCGGIGTPLIRVKGTIADTREGLYPKEEIQ